MSSLLKVVFRFVLVGRIEFQVSKLWLADCGGH